MAIRHRKTPPTRALARYVPPQPVQQFRAAQDGLAAFEQQESTLTLAVQADRNRERLDELIARATCEKQIEIVRAERAKDRARRLGEFIATIG